jgi:hypothetical protein
LIKRKQSLENNETVQEFYVGHREQTVIKGRGKGGRAGCK